MPCDICGEEHYKTYSPDVGPHIDRHICFGCLCKMVAVSFAVETVRHDANMKFLVGDRLPDA